MRLIRTNLLVGLVALCVNVSGCSLVGNGVRTLVIEPLQYPADLEKCQSCSRNHARAVAALGAYQCQNAGCYSDDFAWGFKHGFTDYLDNGGTGQPPPLPPRHYWKLKYQTPEGYRAIQEWFSGFQQGVEVAKASGYREYSVVPVMSPPYTAVIKSEVVALPHDGPAGQEAPPAPASPGTPAEQQVPDGDLLPPPTPQTKPTTGVLLFDEGRDAGQAQDRDLQTPATGMLLFEEKEKTRWQPGKAGNATPELAPQKWDLPHDDKPSDPPPHPAAQPELSRTVSGTVWHASKSQKQDVDAPPPSQ
jgi:hypothetical protein